MSEPKPLGPDATENPAQKPVEDPEKLEQEMASDSSSKSQLQYVRWIITNNSNRTLGIREATKLWGHFWKVPGYTPTQYAEPSYYNDVWIEPGKTYTEMNIYGTKGTASGAEGHYKLIDQTNGERIAKLYGDCPWSGSYTNNHSISEIRAGWKVDRASGQGNGSNNYGFDATISVSRA